ncbi:hypothetical protein FACS18942_01490 [Planctomycetales bacterium]|nr:hypothetical protein FACS18942_01490 [Planctomycetales bacterium]
MSFRFIQMCLFVLTAVSVSVLPAAGICADKYNADELIRLHQKYWGNLQKISVTYVVRQKMTVVDIDPNTVFSTMNGDDFVKDSVTDKIKTTDESWKYHWLSNGQCNTLQSLPMSADAIDNNNRCICRRYDGRYFIEQSPNFSEKDYIPNSLQDSLKHNCSVLIHKQVNMQPRRVFSFANDLGVYFLKDTEPPTADNLYNWITSSESITTVPVKTTDVNKDTLWTFQIRSKKLVEEYSPDEPYAEITINENKNFFLHRYFSYIPPSLSNSQDFKTNKNFDIVFERRTEEYVKIDDRYFPSKIITGFGQSSAWQNDKTKVIGDFYTKEYNIEEISINEYVKEEPCFIIPEHYIVLRDDLLEERREDSFIPISIWGKNNEPLITFYTKKEYDDYMKQASAVPITPQNISPFRIVLTVSGLLLIFISLAMRFYSRKDTSLTYFTKQRRQK